MIDHLAHTTFRSFATSLSIALRTLFLLAVILTANTIVIAQSILDGGTPVGVAPGSPAGAYALSDFESVNLFSGNLNFTLPLLKIGGRGSAQGAIMLPIESHWTNFYFFRREDGSYYNPIPMYNFGGGSASLKPGYGPGVLIPRTSEIRWGEACGEMVWAIDTQTRLTFIAADGTQFELRDTLHDGAPITRMCYQPPPSRGTTFITKDGSAATFISDTVILDGSPPGAPVSGYLILRDGTRYRIDNGLVKSIHDRNGNQITYSYTNDRVTLIRDSLNREITLEYEVNDIAPYGLCDRIRFKGSEGQERIIRVSYSQLSSALASEYTLLTKNQMFPPPFPPDFISESLNTNFDTNVVSSVWLPDDRRYRFLYNGYGELARAELPTGGAFEYVWETTPLMEYEAGYAYPQELLRRVKTRKVINGSTVEQKTSYSYSLPATRNGTTVVTIDHSDDSQPSQAFSQEKHYFYGTPIPLPFTAIQTTLFRDSPWTTGREYQTDLLGANGTPLLRRTTQAWRQRASVSWCTGSPCTQDTAPANDARIVETITTLADTNQVSKRTSIDPGDPSGQTVGFDQFNNQTDVWEYDFGSGAPGSFVRRTHTDYLTAANYVNGNTNPALGAHLRSLPSQQWVSSDLAGVIKVSFTQYEYDNYSPDARHKPLEPRAGITGLCLRVDAAGTCIMLSGVDYQIRGNLTGVTSYDNASILAGPVTVSIQYDVAGNAVASIDGLGKTSTLTFSDSFCNGSTCGGTFTPNTYAFPSLTTAPVPDPSGQHGSTTAFTTTSVYDFWTGAVASMTDANNLTTSFQYNDVLDRLKAIIRPPGGGRTDFEYGDTIGNLFVRTLTDLDIGRRTDSYQYFDALGRGIETRTYENPGQYIAVQQIPFIMQQDPDTGVLVQATQTSNPFRPLSEQPVWTTAFADALGRTTKVRTPDNAIVRTTYSGSSVTVADQAGRQRKSVSDALGRLKELYEAPNDAVNYNYLTSYEYDVLGNLRHVYQGPQTRTFVYDSLKRLTSATNPESGTMSYQYDANGNLTQRTDARGIITTYSYDGLNRNIAVEYTNDPVATPNVFRFYDGWRDGVQTSIPNVNGKLWQTEVSGAKRSQTTINSYDAVGRRTSLTQQRGSSNTPFTVQRQYGLAGQVATQTYPSGHTVTYTYDDAGRTSQFSGNLGDAVSRSYTSALLYDSAGRLSKEQLGTNTPIFNKLRYNSRGQLAEILASTSYTGPNDLTWNRGKIINWYSLQCGGSGCNNSNNNGNLQKQEVFVPLKEQGSGHISWYQQFSYDTLNRLTQVHEYTGDTSLDWQQTFSNDRFGNRTIDTAAGATYGPGINAVPTVIDQLTNRLYAPNDPNRDLIDYDDAGNQTKDFYTGNGQRTYDAENRLIAAQDTGGGWTSYTYDADGQRVETSASTASSSGSARWFIYGFAGELVAEYERAPAGRGLLLQLTGEYGYRNGELLVKATVGTTLTPWGDGSGFESPNVPQGTYQLNPTGSGWSFAGSTGISGNGSALTAGNPDAPEGNQVAFIEGGSSSVISQPIQGLTPGVLYAVTFSAAQRANCCGNQELRVFFSTNLQGTVFLGSIKPSGTEYQSYSSLVFTVLSGTSANISFVGAGSTNSMAFIDDVRIRIIDNVEWLISDHLGTPRMIFDKTGSLAGTRRHDYLPFGEELVAGTGRRSTINGYSTPDGFRQKFTQKERDNETGLDYFLARYYSSTQGRFTSVDPQNIIFDKNRGRNADERARILQSYMVQPQNWNRYAYTRNNPLAYTDPNGRCSAPAGLSKGNVGICIEAFIASPTIKGIGRGDNRDFAPNDPSKTNRIQVQGLFSRSAFAWNTHLEPSANRSQLVIGGRGWQGTITVDPKQTVDKEGNLHLQLKITGESGLAGVPGAPEGKIQINVNLIVTPDGRVGIEGGERTMYPSTGIYVYTMGADGKPAVATLGEGRETVPEALTQPLVPIQPVPPTCNCPKPNEEERRRNRN